MAGIPQSMEILLLKFWTAQTVTALTSPLKAKLTTTASTDAAQGTEVTGGSYTEQSVAWGTPANGASGSPSTVSNSSAINYTAMPAATVNSVDCHDSAGSPQRALYAALSPSKTTGAGDTLSFAIGALAATLV